MVEAHRDKFFEKLKELTSLTNQKVALCLFIPPEWISETQNAEHLILCGEMAIKCLNENGIYSRIGWYSYFVLVTISKKQFSQWADDVFSMWKDISQECMFWRIAFIELQSEPNEWTEIFKQLEWQAHEVSRLKRNEYLFQITLRT